MPLLLSQPDGVGRIIPSPGGASWFAWQVWMKIGGNWLNKVAFLVADFIFECRELLSVVRLKCVSSVSSCMDLTVFGFIAILGDFYSLVFFFFSCLLFVWGFCSPSWKHKGSWLSATSLHEIIDYWNRCHFTSASFMLLNLKWIASEHTRSNVWLDGLEFNFLLSDSFPFQWLGWERRRSHRKNYPWLQLWNITWKYCLWFLCQGRSSYNGGRQINHVCIYVSTLSFPWSCCFWHLKMDSFSPFPF